MLCDLRKGVSKSALSRAKELEQTTTNSPNDSCFRSTAEHLKEARLAGSWVKAFGAFEGEKKQKKTKIGALRGVSEYWPTASKLCWIGGLWIFSHGRLTR